MTIHKIPTTAINAIFFDLDGTLRQNDPDAHHFFFDHAVRLGVQNGPGRHQQAYRWAHRYWSSSEELLADVAAYPPERNGYFWVNYARRYLIAFGSPEEQASELAPTLQQHMSDNYEPENRVVPGTLEMLDQLRRIGYTLGVVTNRNESADEELEELALAPYFDFTLTAGDVGAWKPDRRIFQAALEAGQVRAAETIYVGDNYFADIEGARGAGLHPVLVDPYGLFPDADCPVLERAAQVSNLLG